MEVFLSVGSNIDRESNSRSAVRALRDRFGSLKISPVYESEAVGFKGDPFFNFVVSIETDLPLSEVNQVLKEIEDAHGRKRSGPKFSSRSLDIDVVTFGDFVGELDGVTLPRPELFYNAFVLLPMIDLLQDQIEPKTGIHYKDLKTKLPSVQSIAQIDFDFELFRNEAY